MSQCVWIVAHLHLKKKSKVRSYMSVSCVPCHMSRVQKYAQWHNLHYAQHFAHQVAQYCESNAH